MVVVAIMPVEAIKGKDFTQVRAWPGFSGGLNTDMPATKIPDDTVWDSLNVYFEHDSVLKRPGYKYLNTCPDNQPVRWIDEWFDSAGNQQVVIATNAHIYTWDISGNTFTDRTPLGGLTAIASVNFSGCAFAGKYFLTDSIDKPCYWDGVTATFTWLTTAGAPVSARDVIGYANHLMWFNVNDPTQGYQPQEVIWSDNKNGLVYNSGDAGAAILEDTNDVIIAVEMVTDYLAIARSNSIYLCSFVGYPWFYQFNRRIERYGAISTQAFIKTELSILGLSHNNICAFDGANLDPFIGQPIIRTLKSTFPSNQYIAGSYAVYDTNTNRWRLWVSSRQDGYTDTQFTYSTLYKNWSIQTSAPQDPITAVGFATYGHYPRWQDITTTWANTPTRWSDSEGTLISPAMFFGDISGDIYLGNSGMDDNGQPILSHFKTKQSDMQMPGWIKELNRLQFILDPLSIGTLTIHVYQSDDGLNYTEADNSPVTLNMNGNPTPFVDVFAVGSHFYLNIVHNNLAEWFSIREIYATVIQLFEVDHA
jgi:hypothetical protein